MPDIKVKGYTGDYIHLSGVEKLWMESEESTDAERKLLPYSYGETVAGVQIQPDFSAGDMPVSAGEGLLVKSAVIKKPEGLIPENIAEGEYIAGVGPGTHSGGGGDNYRVPAAFFDPDAETNPVVVCDSMFSPNITAVKSGAFRSASYVHGVELNAVRRIYSSAFYGCQNLSFVSLNECKQIDFDAFGGNYGLQAVHIPQCETIQTYAFYTCYRIKELNLPGCEEIGDYAFQGCTSLSKVSAPKCSIVGISAFSGCPSLPTYNAITYAGDIAAHTSATSTLYSQRNWPLSNGTRVIAGGCFSGKNLFTGLTNAESIEAVGPSAFYSCTNLQTISMPNCKVIGYSAFASCYYLSSVYLPKCEVVSDYAFSSCNNLKTLELPMLKSMPYALFMSNTALKSVYAQACSRIGGRAFYGCVALASVSLPKCAYVGDGAFQSCNNLPSVTLPQCKSILASTFYSCAGLKMASFPVVTYISSYAFGWCQNLYSMYLLGPEFCSVASSTAFYRCGLSTSYGTIYVRSSMIESYRVMPVWSSISSRFVGLSDEEIMALDAAQEGT